MQQSNSWTSSSGLNDAADGQHFSTLTAGINTADTSSLARPCLSLDVTTIRTELFACDALMALTRRKATIPPAMPPTIAGIQMLFMFMWVVPWEAVGGEREGGDLPARDLLYALYSRVILRRFMIRAADVAHDHIAHRQKACETE